MKLLQLKPYWVFWTAMPLIIVLSLVRYKTTIDIKFYNTYYVFYSYQMGLLLALILGFIGGIYWNYKKTQRFKWVTSLHTFFTIGSMILLFLERLLLNYLVKNDLSLFSLLNKVISSIFLIAFISQIVFILNIVINNIRNNNKTVKQKSD